ncbi:hypothetical protein GCM10011316_03240 [Roseibium aquae]|uniref:Uncharacterized protein n=1 Tax=Roseibium aquae TaxID=1323746 RepID=A0A916T7F2_9HYPH|nr:hypothetical protein [Roseibium aquae]GGB34525.1 hypothetical protein GCM10011316_03240 [Roseibium aquae]
MAEHNNPKVLEILQREGCEHSPADLARMRAEEEQKWVDDGNRLDDIEEIAWFIERIIPDLHQGDDDNILVAKEVAFERGFKDAITERRFDVSVWNTTSGDIIRCERDLTPDELAEIEVEFNDEPFADVVIDEERIFKRRADEALAWPVVIEPVTPAQSLGQEED